VIEPLAVNSERLYTPSKPIRDESYLRWIRTLPCSACVKQRRKVEAAHTGPHGMSQKASDYSCIPLCRVHHQEYDSGPQAFQERHGIDVPNLVVQLQAIWQAAEAVRRVNAVKLSRLPVSRSTTPEGDRGTGQNERKTA
jgi:hypothetical protein